MVIMEQQEIKFIGFIGILKQSFRIIFTWRKIFSQITLALILPLSFIFLAHIQVSQLLFFKILLNQDTLYNNLQEGTPDYAKLSDIISSEWTVFWLFKIAYFTFLLVFSLLSTSAVVYAIACIYTSKPITFKKVLSVVPRVWKRLMVTFLWSFAIVFVYNIIAAVVLIILLVVVNIGNSSIKFVFIAIPLIVYFVGLLYITIVWHLASVVSVLEEIYGIKAMIKSKNLIKGNIGVAVALFIMLGICFLGIQLLFEIYMVFGWPEGLGIRIVVGILCLLLLFKLILFGLVIQTVLYFVCKSHHNENIDKSILSDHLEAYLGDYVPLKAANVQMEQYQA
ncbi:uncharacterized protein LOC8263079 [Ricinus communis]|uniref:Uncharacterized protein n=1 Tax=Ricinus communis TaxID=3988 RepID=B9SKX1_RICCO|nr:uncharacterized protein LOC8263079 [Ricinus communis]EEF35752.1 conserved hypothetical protein [Ricinus communis]|eukprot:XP_002526640.1 uncharacterized protein LOC8263079 [Ricinus communis]